MIFLRQFINNKKILKRPLLGPQYQLHAPAIVGIGTANIHPFAFQVVERFYPRVTPSDECERLAMNGKQAPDALKPVIEIFSRPGAGNPIVVPVRARETEIRCAIVDIDEIGQGVVGCVATLRGQQCAA